MRISAMIVAVTALCLHGTTISAACIEGPTGECLPIELEPIDVSSPRALRPEADLAVGISTNARPGGTLTGAIAVFRGRRVSTNTSIPLLPDQFVVRPEQDQQSRDLFGSATVLADFDGDGFEDLIVGIAGGRADFLPDRPGLAAYFRGTHDGFVYDRLLHKPVLGPGGLPGAFGDAMITGDMNGTGHIDLAIGSPGQPFGDVIPGAVYVFQNTGIAPQDGPQFVPPVGFRVNPPDPGDLDNFGWALASADFDGDGRSDLAVGAPGRIVEGVSESGTVYIFGSNGGAPTALEHTINLNTLGRAVLPVRFGQAIEVIDFDMDGRPDLAIGAPAVQQGPVGQAMTGRVYLLRNTADGFVLTAVLDQTGLDEQNNEEGFGYSLAAGDMNGDGLPELAVGAPFNLTPPIDNPGFSVGIPTTFIIANLRRWRNDARIMRGRDTLMPQDILTECFEPRPLRRPVTQLGRNEVVRNRLEEALRLERGERLETRRIPLPPDLPVNNRGFDCNLLIPERNRQPIANRDPKRTGRVFLFTNDNGTLVPDTMLGAGAPHPTQEDSLIGVSLKSADFNGDGFDDLVSGAMGKRPLSGGARGGAAEVFVGGLMGLTYVGELDQTGLSPNVAEDNFGVSLDR